MSDDSRNRPPPGFAPTGFPGNAQVAGVYVVLQGVQAGNPLMGGWAYLQVEPDGVTHEAMDLNSMGGGDADLGASVVAPLAGTVTFVEYWDGWATGFGSHVAVFLDDPLAAAACYLHVAHLDTIAVQRGQRVAAGQPLGTCGKSGNQGYAHCHAAMWWEVPPGGWNFWQAPASAYPTSWVAEHTLDPADWFWASVGKAQGAGEDAVMAILSGAQTAAIQAAVWGDYWNPAASEHAIEASWREEWRRGVWRGAPLSDEQLVPDDPAEGSPAGAWRLFQGGACVWLPGRDVSWDG